MPLWLEVNKRLLEAFKGVTYCTKRLGVKKERTRLRKNRKYLKGVTEMVKKNKN